MKKYRIVKKIYNDGIKHYYIQQKYWLIWLYVSLESLHPDDMTHRAKYDSLEEAKKMVKYWQKDTSLKKKNYIYD